MNDVLDFRRDSSVGDAHSRGAVFGGVWKDLRGVLQRAAADNEVCLTITGQQSTSWLMKRIEFDVLGPADNVLAFGKSLAQARA